MAARRLAPLAVAVAIASLPSGEAAGRHWGEALGPANTPPMGFNTWNLYHCAVTADILTETAEAMVKTGLKEAGYIYVNSDDCWMAFNRSADGSQLPDPSKFPKGFKAVADAIHALGMKSGLYTAKGPHTCQKRAASCLHEAQDAKQWAAWGVDYVKDDSCSTCTMANGTEYTDMDDYHRMWLGIQASGRPMILTVEGSPPADVITHGGYGNAKRVGHDISPSWGSMISLVDIGAGLWPYAHNSKVEKYGGWWNDLDMIEIGNGGGSVAGSALGAAVPPPGGKVMYPWAVAPADAKSKWTMPADGTVRTDNLCLTAAGRVTLAACDPADKATTQTFALNKATGNLHLTKDLGSCLALLGGSGPGLTMAPCKQGHGGANEEFTLTDGKLCSHTLGHGPQGSPPVCLTANATQPPGAGHGHHSWSGGGGFDCAADAKALHRCQVHFTMWTIMKAPLLLGNDIRKMDEVALGVVKNSDALSISQDSLGVQAQRVWVSNSSSRRRSASLLPGFSAAAVAAPCDATRPTQSWTVANGRFMTVDETGLRYCMVDAEGTEDVGSWRMIPCPSEAEAAQGAAVVTAGTRLEQVENAGSSSNSSAAEATVVVRTPGGAFLTLNNALGASGPVPHTRYLAPDRERSAAASSWLRSPAPAAGTHGDDTFRLMHANRHGVRDDDKAGTVTIGGDFCLDVAQDNDSEVWAGPLADKKWAVALLNRHVNETASMTVDYAMFNASSSASFEIKDIWSNKSAGTHQASFTTMVPPQAVAYLLLTPA